MNTQKIMQNFVQKSIKQFKTKKRVKILPTEANLDEPTIPITLKRN